MKLTKHEIARSFEGPELGTGPVIEYVVHGLPSGEEVFVANFGSYYQDSWRILRVKDGVQGRWTGNYTSADEALAVLQPK